jgi:hypothetical protein
MAHGRCRAEHSGCPRVTIDPNRPPPKRAGFRWEYREGCNCKACPWKGNCLGETWPHWREVKIMTKDEIATEYKKITDLLIRCIASTPAEYHADLCRDFRIPPALVVDAHQALTAVTNSSGVRNSEKEI